MVQKQGNWQNFLAKRSNVCSFSNRTPVSPRQYLSNIQTATTLKLCGLYVDLWSMYQLSTLSVYSFSRY